MTQLNRSLIRLRIFGLLALAWDIGVVSFSIATNQIWFVAFNAAIFGFQATMVFIAFFHFKLIKENELWHQY